MRRCARAKAFHSAMERRSHCSTLDGATVTTPPRRDQGQSRRATPSFASTQVLTRSTGSLISRCACEGDAKSCRPPSARWIRTRGRVEREIHAVILRQSSVQLLRRGPSIAHQASPWRPAPAHAIQAPQSWGGTRATQLRSKMHHPSRRFFVAALAATMAPLRARAATPAEERLNLANKRLTEIEAREGGRLGVFVRDTGSGATIEHRADERFPMCSTFKLLAAAAVAQARGRGRRAPRSNNSLRAERPARLCANHQGACRRGRHDAWRSLRCGDRLERQHRRETWSCSRSAGRQGLRNSRVRLATR